MNFLLVKQQLKAREQETQGIQEKLMAMAANQAAMANLLQTLIANMSPTSRKQHHNSSTENESKRAHVPKRLPNQTLLLSELRGSKGQDQSLIIKVSGTNNSPETSPPKRAPRSIDKPQTASNQLNELNTTITSAETLLREISPTSINVSTVRDNEANAAYYKKCELNKEVKECVPIVASSRKDVNSVPTMVMGTLNSIWPNFM